jgi:hypothetical protein
VTHAIYRVKHILYPHTVHYGCLVSEVCPTEARLSGGSMLWIPAKNAFFFNPLLQGGQSARRDWMSENPDIGL